MNKTALEAVRPLDEILSSNLPALLSPEEKLIWLLGVKGDSFPALT